MPSKYPILSSREVVRKLEVLGFRAVAQKGSHKKLTNGISVCIVPMHDEIARGTLKSILMQANITLEVFLEA